MVKELTSSHLMLRKQKDIYDASDPNTIEKGQLGERERSYEEGEGVVI